MTPSVTDVAANGRLVRIAASQHGTKPSGQNGVVKNRRFRPGQKRMSFVRRDRREESNVSDAAFTTNDCFDAPDAIRCKDRHHLRRAHADGESL